MLPTARPNFLSEPGRQLTRDKLYGSTWLQRITPAMEGKQGQALKLLFCNKTFAPHGILFPTYPTEVCIPATQAAAAPLMLGNQQGLDSVQLKFLAMKSFSMANQIGQCQIPHPGKNTLLEQN